MTDYNENNEELDAFGLTASEEETVAAEVHTEAIAAAPAVETTDELFDEMFDDEDEVAPAVNGPFVTVVGGGNQQRYSLAEGQTLAAFVEANNFARGAGVLYFVNGVSATQDRVLASGDTLLVQQNMKGGSL